MTDDLAADGPTRREPQVRFRSGFVFSCLNERWTCDVTVHFDDLPEDFRTMAGHIVGSTLPQNFLVPLDMASSCGLIPPSMVDTAPQTIVVQGANPTYRWLLVGLVTVTAALAATLLFGG